jgi:hypothetical protein
MVGFFGAAGLLGLQRITAHQEEIEWKTYRAPTEFSIDYPVFDKTPNITKEQNTDPKYEVTIIHSGNMSMMIMKDRNVFTDPQERALISKESTTNTTILKDIFTSVYDGNIGYTYVTQNLDYGTVIAKTFIQRGDNLYTFTLVGVWNYPNLFETFDRILGSIKFFD